ncbi:TonB-dependent receptor plug domain-containing protein [Aquabacterium sp.]|uniref:TonB-dependent receptor plug domain-containing protein n=1 Tax=Aquabacterium sp. TaxID=1872578 RepID=UPI002BFD3CE3|nr:TonB-dependent receptor [Aquabacterium sp.]HSW08881.1 TonB-dependent receptor [Aquabacterium sp.]
MTTASPLHLTFLAALSLTTAPCLADTADDDELVAAYGDKASISLATGTRQAMRRAPAVATVITAEDIAAMGATDLDQVLETVPGLHVNVAPSMRNALYVMRGVFSLQTPQVLVLQNGIPITVQLTGGRGNLSGGPAVENIARIEIIRGPGSALFGADAFSGVINIITRGPGDSPGTRVGARAGSFGSAGAWLQQGGKQGGLDYAAFLKFERSAGFERTIESDAQSRNDRGFGTHASLAPGPVNAGGESIDAGLDLSWGAWRWRTLYKLRDDLGTYAGLGSALDPIGRGSGERLISDLGWASAIEPGGWSYAANLSLMHYAQRYAVPPQIFPPGTRLPTGVFVDGMFGAPEVSERSLRLSATATYAGWADHSLRLGVGHDDLDLYMTREINNFSYTATGIPVPAGALRESPLPFIYPQRRHVDHVFLQDEWQLRPDWTLTAGLRHDRYSDAGSTTNPRAALVWDAGVDWTVKLLYGQAFRAPSFSELYATNNPIARGNPNLKPETTRTLEAVLNWAATPRLQLNLNLYAYRMRDILRTLPNPAPTPGTRYSNTGRQNGRGLETEAVWDATRQLRMSGHVSLAQTVDPATGLDVGNVPRRDLFLRADWRLASGWRINALANHVAGRRRAPGDVRPPVADYTTVDLALASDSSAAGWTFSATLRNAFDADVREPSLAPGLVANDLPQAGRSFTLQVGYLF